jgi:hypothetical protein
MGRCAIDLSRSEASGSHDLRALVARSLATPHGAVVRLHLLHACILILTSACGGTARFVVRDPTGGLIALEGDGYGEAQRLMGEHCGGSGYRVTADGVYTVATRQEQTITGQEQGRRLADNQSLTTSAFSGGAASSAVPTGGQATFSTGDGVQAFDSTRDGRTTTLPVPVRERRVEYECNVEDE